MDNVSARAEKGVDVKISKSIHGRGDLPYTSVRRGLYKKRLAPDGGTFLVVKIKHEKYAATYSSHYLMPTTTLPEQQQALETALVNSLREKYAI